MEIIVKIPPDLEEKIKMFPEEELSRMIIEFLRLKVFEEELKRSEALQRAALEALAAKSKLTQKDALELGEKIKEGMLQELKEKGLI
jgi:hypothetical protein